MVDLLILVGFGGVVFWIYKFGKSAGANKEQVEELDYDSWEGMFFGEATDPRAVRCDLEITYTDANLNTTRRKITTREFDHSLYGGVIIAWCHLRNAHRTFRFDRIKRAVDIETGEIIKDIRTYMQHRYDTSPEAKLDHVFDTSIQAVRALLYIAKADGRFTQREKEIYLSFMQRNGGTEILDMETMIRGLSEITVPTMQGFKILCGKIASRGNEYKHDVIETARALVATEATISGAEEDALKYMEKRFSV